MTPNTSQSLHVRSCNEYKIDFYLIDDIISFSKQSSMYFMYLFMFYYWAGSETLGRPDASYLELNTMLYCSNNNTLLELLNYQLFLVPVLSINCNGFPFSRKIPIILSFLNQKKISENLWCCLVHHVLEVQGNVGLTSVWAAAPCKDTKKTEIGSQRSEEFYFFFLSLCFRWWKFRYHMLFLVVIQNS